MSHFEAGPDAEEQINSKIPYHNLLFKLAPLLDLLSSTEACPKGDMKTIDLRDDKKISHAKKRNSLLNEGNPKTPYEVPKRTIRDFLAPGHVKNAGDNYTIERNEKEKNNKQTKQTRGIKL